MQDFFYDFRHDAYSKKIEIKEFKIDRITDDTGGLHSCKNIHFDRKDAVKAAREYIIKYSKDTLDLVKSLDE